MQPNLNPMQSTAKPVQPRNLRDGIWMIIHTVHLGVMLTKDGSVAVVMHNDGMTSRSPGLTADQAEHIAATLIQAAAESRAAVSNH